MSTASVVTAIRVLESLSELQPVGLSALARQLNASKATVLRMLSTLSELGWVTQSSGVEASWSMTFHAYAVVARNGTVSSLREIALGPMNGLQLDTTETIHLAVPDGQELVVIERLDTSHVLRAFLALGTRVPMHASGTGLAFLAASEDSFITDYLSRPLENISGRSITTEAALWVEINQIRERGYSINEEGLSTGITSVGAAVIGGNSKLPIACVSISGPSNRITSDKFEEYGRAVASAAQEIGRQASTSRLG
ncbi:IclR family transcriptional regulator [Psychromicrobium lacuslunae]|uniref:IclR family transcriptional regulator n=1 Tax=Psychromicrobium lacuslunae TaxID=1618207 RepID=UPI0006977C01|nr:IclR family transcriptional regulator [Psychromicrobium lacuslunae]